MARTRSKNDSPKGEEEDKRKFSQEQYDMLKRCSDKNDMTEWNQWRKNNPVEDVLLEKANLQRFHLQDTYLSEANLQGALLSRANLQGADLRRANLEGAILPEANLQGADLCWADLQSANLFQANLQGADLKWANLEGARLFRANLQGASLLEANLKKTNIKGADIQEADFSRAIVDGETLIWKCNINRKTKFEGVGLGNIRIYPDERQLLEYNIRRSNWEEFYKWKDWDKVKPERERNKAVKALFQLVKLFWTMSDYGRSTVWVICWFLWFAAIFAVVYHLWPGCLTVDTEVGKLLGLFHSVFFSVVKMTTLGFGDIHANPNSWSGQLLLMIQVLLGYVMLGALVTRFAVLFTAGGPAGKFTEMDEETKKKLEEIRAKRIKRG